MRSSLLLAISALSVVACATIDATMDKVRKPFANQDRLDRPVKMGEITGEGLAEHIEILASDTFKGRAPASEGGRLTREYLVSEMKALGLEPANGDSYEQAVGLVEQTVMPQQSSLHVTMADGTKRPLTYGMDTVFWSKQVKPSIAFDESDMVFVGFGVVAPEYGWNDYEGIDVTGKTVVMLINDPGFHLEGDLFNGRAMTYYGRWTYKYEEAARQGAAGAIIIHQTAPAAYGWGVVEGSWSGPQLDLERPDDGASRTALEGWVSEAMGNELLAAIGHTVESATKAALSDEFEPIPMTGMTATARMRNVINRSKSANVAGMIKGKTNPDDYVLYMAHWDHLGETFAPIGGGAADDLINNGAVDNATGTAALLAMAESYTEASETPDRSVLFVAVTAEESGLLGSAYFAEKPLVPFNHIVGGINMDAIAPTPPAKDIIVVGYGASELEDILKGVADEYGKYLRPDASPEKGYFYRSDHISLAKKGVPMLYADAGIDLIEGGEEAGRAWGDDYTKNRYHKPADEYDEDWDMRGITETVMILRDVGAELAYSDQWPNWYEGNEFRALRDAQMAERD